MDIHLKETIPKVFQPIHKAVQNEGIQEVVAKGGRGSGKSSYLSLELVLQLLRHPDCHAVVLRKVAGTLRNSVYNHRCAGMYGLLSLHGFADGMYLFAYRTEDPLFRPG